MKHRLTTLILLLCTLTVFAQKEKVTGPKKKPQTTTVPAKPKQQTSQTKQHKQQAASSNQAHQQARRQHAPSVRISYDESNNCIVFGNNQYKMVYVSGGSYMMGESPKTYPDTEDEKPVHRVAVNSFYIGQTEVTQAFWRAVMGNNPSYNKGDNFPVEDVSWYDCQKFINRLNSLTGRKFRLPTEAEWEFAARGGNQSRGYEYSGSDNIEDVTWYTGYGTGNIQAVATKQANELGIYDMSGNVWEWCSDWYGSDYYKNSESNNPIGPNKGTKRVLRGGGYGYIRQCSRVVERNSREPEGVWNVFGFRLALVP